ncbi:MAG UNVERIFIED_CONTAM: hypothetical protein LVT10_08150 [Anaerolineae bacterium]
MRRIICTRLHTSAGRIPTDQGFRYYVKYRMSFDSLSQSEKRYISTQLLSLPLAIEKWMRMATQQLHAHATHRLHHHLSDCRNPPFQTFRVDLHTRTVRV